MAKQIQDDFRDHLTNTRIPKPSHQGIPQGSNFYGMPLRELFNERIILNIPSAEKTTYIKQQHILAKSKTLMIIQ